ncbi:MAG: ABC transporter substrate-binding protein [Nocardioides sp.]
MLTSRLRLLTALAVVPLLGLGACAPADDTGTAAEPSTAVDGDNSSEMTEVTSCAIQDLNLITPGTLTIGTDSPAYPPYFEDNDPSNGKGFESAVAYALAQELGFTADQVTWVKVPFNNSYKPGAKDFDFDINQISITAKRAKVVDFSMPYYNASQAVIALKDSPAASVTALADLKDLKLGAQTGTTSLTAIREIIQPTQDPLVFQSTSAAKQAMQNGQVDGVLMDLPTAFYTTAVEIPKAKIIGQFQPATGEQEQFGLLMAKGNSLKSCVDFALQSMIDNGTLAGLEKQWMSDTVGVPELQ